MNDYLKTDSSESEAEMALLALCMRKDEAILKTVENRVSAEDFADPRNRTVFSVVMDMFFNNAHIDRITVYAELERRVHKDCKVAFGMYPTSIGELFAVADAHLLMPPKSTWFEPKLRSGLFIHSIKA